MKLDKLKFARLIGFIERVYALNLKQDDIELIDEIIDIDIPKADYVYPSDADINALMAVMFEGRQKIEAIKLHRKLTGYGLKESKDEVEKYWPRQTNKEMLNDMLSLIDNTMTGQNTMLSNMGQTDLSAVKAFVNTYVPKI